MTPPSAWQTAWSGRLSAHQKAVTTKEASINTFTSPSPAEKPPHGTPMTMASQNQGHVGPALCAPDGYTM